MKSIEEIYEELSGLIRECRWEEIESFLQTCMDEAKEKVEKTDRSRISRHDGSFTGCLRRIRGRQ